MEGTKRNAVKKEILFSNWSLLNWSYICGMIFQSSAYQLRTDFFKFNFKEG